MSWHCFTLHHTHVVLVLQDQYQPRGRFGKTKVAMTIHNIAFQGRFWRDSYGTLHLPPASLDKFLFEDGSPRVRSRPRLSAS